MKAKIINKKVQGFIGDAWLVKLNNKYFVVSGVDAVFSGWEVLVFKSDKYGVVNDFIEVAGGRGITHEEAIKELEGKE